MADEVKTLIEEYLAAGSVAPMRVQIKEEWDEGLHPRGPDGKFGEGGGESQTSGGSSDAGKYGRGDPGVDKAYAKLDKAFEDVHQSNIEYKRLEDEMSKTHKDYEEANTQTYRKMEATIAAEDRMIKAESKGKLSGDKLASEQAKIDKMQKEYEDARENGKPHVVAFQVDARHLYLGRPVFDGPGLFSLFGF